MIPVDAEVIRHSTSGYTVKLYVPVLNQVSMDKFYFTGDSKTQAISKARAKARECGYKLNMVM